MTELNYTKGEDWITYCGEENWYVIVKDKPNRPDKVIAKIINCKEEKANAYLIAQSPRMAELLKIIVDEAPWKIDPEWQKMAREILKSAEVA